MANFGYHVFVNNITGYHEQSGIHFQQEKMEDVESGEEIRPEDCLIVSFRIKLGLIVVKKGRNMLVVMANGDEASGR